MLRVVIQRMSAVRRRYLGHGDELNGRAATGAGAHRFFADRSGGVMFPAAIALVVTLVAAGGAIDFGRWMNARTELRSAVNSAVLAAARNLQSPDGTVATAKQAAKDYLVENTKGIIPLNIISGNPDNIENLIQFDIVDGGTAVSATGAVDIESAIFQNDTVLTHFFPDLANLAKLPIFRGSGADESKVKLRVGASAERNLEVSVMLDVTGSMGGSKLESMKTAAKNLIDIIVWEDQSEFQSRVALVPFSEAVNVSNLKTDEVLRKTTDGSDKKTEKQFDDKWGNSKTVYRQDACAVERMGSEAFNDTKPSNQSTRFRRLYRQSNGYCNGMAPIAPLSSNKVDLKSQIDALTAGGYTGGHLGTAWAWYMLSPNFNNVMPNNASKPAEYADVSQPLDERTIRKYAVLMTDGEYNIQYCGKNNKPNSDSGLTDKNSSYKPMDCTAQNGSSVVQARTLCTNMKAKGIEVYTVGFQLQSGGTAEATMQQCASSPDHAFIAATDEQLNQAFQDIALQIAELYLAK